MEASLWPLIDTEHVCEGTRQVNLELQIWGTLTVVAHLNLNHATGPEMVGKLRQGQ